MLVKALVLPLKPVDRRIFRVFGSGRGTVSIGFVRFLNILKLIY